MTKEDKIKDIISKYFPEEDTKKQKKKSDSTREYKIFQEESKTKSASIFENLCNKYGKILPVEMSKKDKENMNNAIAILNMKTRPEYIMGFSVILLFLGVILTLLIFALTGNVLLILGAGLGTFAVFNYARNFPYALVEINRARASSETVLAVLYIVIFMRHTPNLESAVQFAAENLTGPLSYDFRKLFWDVETRKYDNIKMALDEYVLKWMDYNRPFVDSIYLIESSIFQRNEYRRLEMLDRAINRILEGSYENMLRYARELQNPIEVLYMMGIMLPVMGLVLLPIVSMFMADLVTPDSIVLLYNFLLPGVVFFVGRGILTKKPVGFPSPNIDNHPQVPKKGEFILLKNFTMKAYIPAVIFFLIFLIPFIFFLGIGVFNVPSELSVYLSFLPVIALSGSIIIYCKLILKDRWYIRDTIMQIESSFGDAIFQLGNRLSDGLPAEIAIEKVSETLKKSSIEGLFTLIIHNIKKLGMDLDNAIFNPKDGASNYYPSPLIKSILRILIQSAKKSSEIASVSMINIARYLSDIHNIDQKIKDVFSETLSSMKFQAAFLTPIVCGIVVGLTSMIVIILTMLTSKITEMAALSEEFGGLGLGTAFISGFFAMKNALPLHIFQIVVAFYMIEVSVLISYLLSQLESSGDYMSFAYSTVQILMIAAIMYLIVSFVTTFIFAGMSRTVVTIGSGIGAY